MANPIRNMVRIALVEDSASKARFIRGILEAADIEVVDVTHTAKESTRLTRTQPDIVLVDRMLPDGDGMAVADDLSFRIPQARVYLYSATDPAAVLPAHIGYLRDADAPRWPAILTGAPPEDVFVRHPKARPKDRRAGGSRKGSIS